jgi:FixH
LIGWRWIATSAAIACASPLAAQTVYPGVESGEVDVASPIDAEAQGSDDIVVVGDNGGAYRLTADSLRDAARAYAEHRGEFAPQASLYFAVEAGDGGTLDGLALYLRARRRSDDGGRAIVELPLGEQGRFVLPLDLLLAGDWDLRANRARGGIRIRPLVLSSGSEIADRRFGDMRLQCRVSIAFARLSLPVRLLAGALGPCGSSRVRLFTSAPRPLSVVTITGYAEPIEVRADGMSYEVPLSVASIGNEERLRHIYR